MVSQSEQILSYLKAGNTITPIEALERFGCFRLGARVSDLKEEGYNIVNEWESKGRKKYAKYKLIPKETLF